MCNVGAGDWLVLISNQTQTVGFVNNQTQHPANLMHQPATVTQTTSFMEPSVIEKINVTNGSKQTHRCSPSVVCAYCFDRNVSKRTGEMPNEQVSAKPTPLHGLCLTKRKDGSEAMKEVGRNEQNPSNAAWDTRCDHLLRPKKN